MTTKDSTPDVLQDIPRHVDRGNEKIVCLAKNSRDCKYHEFILNQFDNAQIRATIDVKIPSITVWCPEECDYRVMVCNHGVHCKNHVCNIIHLNKYEGLFSKYCHTLDASVRQQRAKDWWKNFKKNRSIYLPLETENHNTDTPYPKLLDSVSAIQLRDNAIAIRKEVIKSLKSFYYSDDFQFNTVIPPTTAQAHNKYFGAIRHYELGNWSLLTSNYLSAIYEFNTAKTLFDEARVLDNNFLSYLNLYPALSAELKIRPLDNSLQGANAAQTDAYAAIKAFGYGHGIDNSHLQTPPESEASRELYEQARKHLFDADRYIASIYYAEAIYSYSYARYNLIKAYYYDTLYKIVIRASETTPAPLLSASFLDTVITARRDALTAFRMFGYSDTIKFNSVVLPLSQTAVIKYNFAKTYYDSGESSLTKCLYKEATSAYNQVKTLLEEAYDLERQYHDLLTLTLPWQTTATQPVVFSATAPSNPLDCSILPSPVVTSATIPLNANEPVTKVPEPSPKPKQTLDNKRIIIL